MVVHSGPVFTLRTSICCVEMYNWHAQAQQFGQSTAIDGNCGAVQNVQNVCYRLSWLVCITDWWLHKVGAFLRRAYWRTHIVSVADVLVYTTHTGAPKRRQSTSYHRADSSAIMQTMINDMNHIAWQLYGSSVIKKINVRDGTGGRQPVVLFVTGGFIFSQG